MPLLNEPNPAALPDAAADALFAGSLRRIELLLIVFPALFVVAFLIQGRVLLAFGLLVGAAIAYVNFRWLKGTVTALTDALTKHEHSSSGPSVIARFLLRFVLIALAAYAIFEGCPRCFLGFLGGLFSPVLAIFFEAAYLVLAEVRESRLFRKQIF